MTGNSPNRNPIEVLADEFLEKYRRGERPSVADYRARHPDLAAQIDDLFPALVMMEDIAPGSEAVSSNPQSKTEPQLEQLGDYRVIREIARGGMGIVYEAEQESLKRRVALKILPQRMLLDARHEKRFVREARAAARLHHTNIVPVFGVGEDQGLHYYAMQFINGLGLDEVLKELRRLRESGSGWPVLAVAHPSQEPPAAAPRRDRQPMTAAAVAQSMVSGQIDQTLLYEPEGSSAADFSCDEIDRGASSRAGDARDLTMHETSAGRLSATLTLSGTKPRSEATGHKSTQSTYWKSVARVGVQVAEALQYAHEQGIQHRDVKPSNLLLDARGTVWVTDFGLAKIDDQQNLTHTGDVLGTVRYMAPECFGGGCDARSDVYSLGLTLYELLALEPAFGETDRHKLIRQVMQGAPRRLQSFDPHIPRDLQTIVHKAIDREPAHRYQTAQELAEDLQRFLDDEPIRARRISIAARFGRWCRRNPAVAGLTSTIALLLVTAAVVSGLAAVQFRDLADRNFDLVGEKTQALAQAQEDKRAAEQSESRARSAQTAAERAQAAAEAQSRRLAANVDLALEALDEVYLQFAEQRLTQEAELDEADRRLLEKALPFYEAFAQQEREGPGRDAALARVSTRVGAINRRLREYDRSEAALVKALALWDEICRDDDSLECRTERANARHELAMTLRAREKWREAEPHARRLVAEFDKLRKEESKVVRHHEMHGVALRDLGLTLENLAKPKAAEEAYIQAVAALQRLVDQHPGHVGGRTALAAALSRQASLQRGGAREQARETLAEAMTRYRQLVTEQPERQELAEAFATGSRTFATMLREAGRDNEAEETFLRAIEQYRRVVEIAPRDPEKRHGLSSALDELAWMYDALGRAEESLECYAEAAAIMRTVTEWYPKKRYYHLELGSRLRELGRTHYRLEQYDQARQAFDEARAEFETWSNGKGHWLGIQGEALDYRARVGRELAQPDDQTERFFREAIDKFTAASRERPEIRWIHRRLGDCQLEYLRFLVAGGRYGDAQHVCEDMIQRGAEFAAEFGVQSNNVADAHWALAELRQLNEQVPEALAQAALFLDGLPNARIDYKLRIDAPGLYRLYVRGAGRDGAADSVYVRIRELFDGPLGTHADWYLLNKGEWHGNRFRWSGRGFFEGTGNGFERVEIDGSPEQPAVWEIERPGVYTLEFLVREDGFAIDQLIFQKCSVPGPDGDDPVETAAFDGQMHVAQDGRVALEAEDFSDRAAHVAPPESEQELAWQTVPGDAPQPISFTNHRGRGYVQCLPDATSLRSALNPTPIRPREQVLQAHAERLTRMIALDPDEAEWYLARGRVRELHGEPALDDYIRLVELKPEQSSYWKQLAGARWRQGNYDQALADIRSLLELQQAEVRAGERKRAEFNNAAWTLLREPPAAAEPRHYAQLLEWARVAVDELPDSTATWSTLGTAYYRSGRYREAVDALRLANILAGASSSFSARYAMALSKNGQPDAARKWLAVSLAIEKLGRGGGPYNDSFQSEAAQSLGLSLESLKGHAPSNEDALLAHMVELEPHFVAIHRQRAEQHAADDESEAAAADRRRAVAACDRLLATLPDGMRLARVPLLLKRGRSLWESEEYARAADDFRRVIELEPRSVKAWNLRGIQLNRLKLHEAALADYSQAIELKPKDHVLWGNRAYTYGLLGKHSLAAVDWLHALEHRPDDSRSLKKGAAACYRAGRHTDAARLYGRLVELEPDNLRYHNLHGIALSRSHRWQDAVDEYDWCLERQPEGAFLWHNRAAAYWAVGLEAKALADYGRCIELEPRMIFLSNQRSALGINTRYLQRFPDDAAGWENRGWLHSSQADDAAEFCFSYAIGLAPDVARYRRSRANWRRRSGNLERAAEDVLAGIRLEPDATTELSNLVGVYAKQQDWPAAAGLLQGAIESGASTFRPYYELALVQLSAGDRDGYRAACRALVEAFRDAEDADTAAFVAWTCALAPGALDDYSGAIALARRAATSDDPLQTNSLGSILYRAGASAEALLQLERMAAFLEEHDDARTTAAYTWYFLAMLYREMGFDEQAQTWLDKGEAWEAENLARSLWNRRATLAQLREEARTAAPDTVPSANILLARAVELSGEEFPQKPFHTIDAEAWHTLGKSLGSEKHWPEAVAAFDRALELNPEFIDAHLRRSWALRGSGDHNAAIAAADRAIELQPDSPRGYRERGYAHGQKRDWNALLADMDKAIELGPTWADAHRHRSWALRALGRVDEALIAATAAIDSNPEFPWGYWERGLAYQSQQEWEKALADYNAAIALKPETEGFHRHRLTVLGKLGRHDEMLADATKAIELKPTAKNFRARAEYYAARRQWDQAIGDYTQAIALQPESADWVRRRAQLCRQAGRLETSLAGYTAAIRLAPGVPGNYVGRAATYNSLREYEKALADCDAALQLDGQNDNYWLYTRRLRALRGLRRFDRALAETESLIEQYPDKAWPLHERAAVFAEQRQWQPALEALDRAVAVEPKNNGLWCTRSVILLQAGDRDGFDAYCRRLCAEHADDDSLPWACGMAPLAPDVAATLLADVDADVGRNQIPVYRAYNYGVALYRAGQYERALEQFNDAVAFRGGGGCVFDWLFLAMTYHQLGNRSKAQEWYDKASARLDSPQDDAWTAQNRLHLQLLRREAEQLLQGEPQDGQTNPPLTKEG